MIGAVPHPYAFVLTSSDNASGMFAVAGHRAVVAAFVDAGVVVMSIHTANYAADPLAAGYFTEVHAVIGVCGNLMVVYPSCYAACLVVAGYVGVVHAVFH